MNLTSDDFICITDSVDGKRESTYRKWLGQSYIEFALYGPPNIKIERIAKDANITRTSFYHYFTDKEALINQLLDLHDRKLTDYTTQLKNCKEFIPDVINLIVRFKLTFLFQKQLGIHRNIEVYNKLYTRLTQEDVVTAKLWADFFNLKLNETTLHQTHIFLIESLFNYINEGNLNDYNLIDYFMRSGNLVRGLIQGQ